LRNPIATNTGKIHDSAQTMMRAYMIITLAISPTTSNICVGPIASAMIAAKSRDLNDTAKRGKHIGIVGMDGTEILVSCAGSVY
jgi:hypothetical protein